MPPPAPSRMFPAVDRSKATMPSWVQAIPHGLRAALQGPLITRLRGTGTFAETEARALDEWYNPEPLTLQAKAPMRATQPQTAHPRTTQPLTGMWSVPDSVTLGESNMADPLRSTLSGGRSRVRKTATSRPAAARPAARPTQIASSPGEAATFSQLPQDIQGLFGTLAGLRQQNAAVAARGPMTGAAPASAVPAGAAPAALNFQDTNQVVAPQGGRPMFTGPEADRIMNQRTNASQVAARGAAEGPWRGGQPIEQIAPFTAQDDARTDAIGADFQRRLFGGGPASQSNRFEYNPETNTLRSGSALRQDLIARGLMTPEGRAIINRPGAAASSPVGAPAAGGMDPLAVAFGGGAAPAGGDPGNPMAAMMQAFLGGGQQQPTPRELVQRNAQHARAARQARLGIGDPMDMMMRQNPMAFAAVQQAQGQAGAQQGKLGLGMLEQFVNMQGNQAKLGAQNFENQASVLGALPALIEAGVIQPDQAQAIAAQFMGGMGFNGGGATAAGGAPKPLTPVDREKLKPLMSDPEAVVADLRRRGFKGADLSRELNKIYGGMQSYRTENDPSGWSTMFAGEYIDEQGQRQLGPLGRVGKGFADSFLGTSLLPLMPTPDLVEPVDVDSQGRRLPKKAKPQPQRAPTAPGPSMPWYRGWLGPGS